MERVVALDLENRFQFARDAGTQPSEAMHPTGKVRYMPYLAHRWE
jgi:hypothetical protein